MGHILYVPLAIAVGVFIGYQLGLGAAEQRAEKKRRIQRARDKRSSDSGDETSGEDAG